MPVPPYPPPLGAVPRGSARFPRTARLLKPGEFQRVQAEGRTYDLGPLVVRVAPARPPSAAVGARPELPPSEGQAPGARLGLAVSRRVGSAVVRNHVKRRVREWFRHRRGLLAGFDLVVTARPAAAPLDQAAVARILEALLVRLGRS